MSDQNTESIGALALLGAEELAKEVMCQELPIVEKHIANTITTLKAKGLHPLKIEVLEWLEGVLKSAQSVCPVPVQDSTATGQPK